MKKGITKNINNLSLSPGVSPSPTSLLDRYSSPPAGMARRRLFVDPPEVAESGVASTGGAPAATPAAAIAVAKTEQQTSIVTTIPAGQTLVTMGTATVTAENGQTVTIPVQGEAGKTGTVSHDQSCR